MLLLIARVKNFKRNVIILIETYDNMCMITYDDYISLKRSKLTRRTVTVSFRRYFRILNYADVSDLQSLSISYLSSGRDYFDDIKNYLRSLVDLGYAPNTISNSMHVIYEFLRWNGFEYTPIQLSIIRSLKPRSVGVRDEDIFDVRKLRSLLYHCDTCLTALILVLVSSGMRIGEALSITSEQIRDNEIYMRVDQMKSRKPHVYYISSEALQALDEWKRVRDIAILNADNRTKKCFNHFPVNREPIFVYSYSFVSRKFKNALSAAGLSRLTFHSIRKFTDSTMKLYIPSNLANSLIGHYEEGDISYRRYSRDQLREAYKKVEPYLIIQAPENYAELQSETQQQLSNHDKLLVQVLEEKMDLEKRLQRLERLVNALEQE